MPQHISFPDGYIHLNIAGPLTGESLQHAAETIANVENSCRRTPHRLIDLTDVTSIEVGFSQLWSLAQRCKMHPARNPTKCAIVAPLPVQVGCARMYQAISDRPGVAIAIFSQVPHAREWIFSTQLMDPELGGIVAAPSKGRPPIPVFASPADSSDLNPVMFQSK